MTHITSSDELFLKTCNARSGRLCRLPSPTLLIIRHGARNAHATTRTKWTPPGCLVGQLDLPSTGKVGATSRRPHAIPQYPA